DNAGDGAMSCIEFILLGVLFFGAIGALARFKKTRPPQPSTRTESVTTESVKYRLVHRSIRAETDEPLPAGNGYYVLRVIDKRRLSWETLPPGLLSFSIAGTSSHQEALQKDAFAPGSSLSLLLEPDNIYDPGAIKICSPDLSTQVGYVPGELAPKVRNALKRGEIARCISLWEETEMNRRISLRVLVVSKGIVLET
ncbi:MAG: HIRAN domain-containing protein, partial [bacterium]